MTELKPKMSAVAIALAAAGLAGCASSGPGGSSAALSSAGTTDLVHCSGVNACKGHNDCKTANNACAGKSACKGQGFVAMPSKACADVGGRNTDSWVGSTSTADFVHCYGVSACKGHNDCKTATNSCAGKSSCKGTGFVALPAKACTDVGGKAGA